VLLYTNIACLAVGNAFSHSDSPIQVVLFDAFRSCYRNCTCQKAKTVNAAQKYIGFVRVQFIAKLTIFMGGRKLQTSFTANDFPSVKQTNNFFLEVAWDNSVSLVSPF
jgi:hypothetical protein